MTDYAIPCDTFVRLCNVIHDPLPDANEWFNAVRIDNHQAVATNRKVMAIENIAGGLGIVHIAAHPQLIEQCRKEAAFHSTLYITVNETLRFASAKTTMGYVHPGNCAVWSNSQNDLDKWRSIVLKCKDAALASLAGMMWSADDVARLAAASPSGRVVFEEFIVSDGSRPTIIRDIYDPDWLGVFMPYAVQEHYAAATLPNWMVA